MRWDGRPFSVGADAPGRPLLPLRGNSPSAHIGPSYSRLMHLPCNPFLYLIFCQASGGPLDGSLLAAKPLRPTLQTCHWHVCSRCGLVCAVRCCPAPGRSALLLIHIQNRADLVGGEAAIDVIIDHHDRGQTAGATQRQESRENLPSGGMAPGTMPSFCSTALSTAAAPLT